MNKEKMILIAEKNLRKAKISLQQNINRSGATELEKQNLSEKIEYAQIVYDLILNM